MAPYKGTLFTSYKKNKMKKPHLQLLEECFGPTRVAIHTRPKGNWMYGVSNDLGPTEWKEINHRRVYQNELVWDFDYPDKEQNLECARKTQKKLEQEGIHSRLWDSGGKGYHLHAFFDKEQMREHTKLKKKILLQHFANGEFDEQMTHTHMIRLEYGFHEKTGCFKQPLLQNPHINFREPNKVPEWVFERVEILALEKRIRMIRYKHERQHNDAPPECTLAFYSDQFYNLRDGVQRAMFVLGATIAQYYDVETCVNELIEWNRKCYYKMKEGEIRKKVLYWKRQQRKMGCEYRHEFLKAIGVSHECKGV